MTRLDPRTVARALGGDPYRNYALVPGPGHSRHDRSLSVKLISDAPDGVSVRSFAGDSRSACREYVLSKLGLSPAPRLGQRRGLRVITQRSSIGDDAGRTAAALRYWDEAHDPNGTVVARYLASRGLHLPDCDALRFHPGLWHPSGGVWPAMIGLVTCGINGVSLAVHRTFLSPSGSGKAPITPTRMMFGPCSGGCVRLAEAGDLLMVGEGIETVLSAMQASGHPAWAALTTSGLRALDLPNSVREVIVLADADKAGEAAARNCALRWKREGRLVRIARPPPGLDFNDLLLGAGRGAARETTR